MGFSLQRDTATIVMRGPFQAKTLNPIWFIQNDLIRPEVLNDAEIQFISPDFSIFRLEWLSIDVKNDILEATARDNTSFELLRDLIIGTLSLLDKVPVRALGINRNMEFQAESAEEWHAFGHKIAPKGPWADFMENPGLLSLQMVSTRIEPIGKIQVLLRNSENLQNGIYISVNSHYDNKEKDIQYIMAILRDYFEKDITLSASLADHLISWKNK